MAKKRTTLKVEIPVIIDHFLAMGGEIIHGMDVEQFRRYAYEKIAVGILEGPKELRFQIANLIHAAEVRGAKQYHGTLVVKATTPKPRKPRKPKKAVTK